MYITVRNLATTTTYNIRKKKKMINITVYQYSIVQVGTFNLKMIGTEYLYRLLLFTIIIECRSAEEVTSAVHWCLKRIQ